MIKRKLRFFCDYMADSPLWECWPSDAQEENNWNAWAENEYNKTKETLLSFGVSKGTILLIEALQFIFEWPPHDERWPHYEDAYYALAEVIIERLQEEIGDKFEIEVL